MSSDELKNIVWVNKLAKDVTEDDVRTHFVKCGSIKTLLLCSSRNRMLSYCFIEFDNESCAQKALGMNDTTMGSDRIVVATANARSYERSVKRTEARARINAKVTEDIKGMSEQEIYHYGFKQGRRYTLNQMSRIGQNYRGQKRFPRNGDRRRNNGDSERDQNTASQ